MNRTIMRRVPAFLATMAAVVVLVAGPADAKKKIVVNPDAEPTDQCLNIAGGSATYDAAPQQFVGSVVIGSQVCSGYKYVLTIRSADGTSSLGGWTTNVLGTSPSPTVVDGGSVITATFIGESGRTTYTLDGFTGLSYAQDHVAIQVKTYTPTGTAYGDRFPNNDGWQSVGPNGFCDDGCGFSMT